MNSGHRIKTSIAPLLLGVFLIATNSHAGAQIFNGQQAQVGEYPAVFSFQTESSNGSLDINTTEESCTGFLVHPRLILTAAHCLQGQPQIQNLTNAADISKASPGKISISGIAGFKANPGFVGHSKDLSKVKDMASTASDIGYILLKKEIPNEKVIPLPIYVTDDFHSMAALDNLDATLIGYGATQWQADGNYEHARVGVKHFTTKPITDFFMPGFIRLIGEKTGALPGDSGGPILATIEGETKVVALDEGMTASEKTVPKMDRNGKIKTDRNGKPKTESMRIYGSTLGTLLTRTNLCWVEKESGIEIPGVDCP